jgi:AraC-like DNA-binding protein
LVSDPIVAPRGTVVTELAPSRLAGDRAADGPEGTLLWNGGSGCVVGRDGFPDQLFCGDLHVDHCITEPARYGSSGRRANTVVAHRRLVGDCATLLEASFHEHLALRELAHRLGASPYHLSRVFHQVTGITVSQYRTWLRVHAVLGRLDAGDDDLATVAADTGFADHAHMTRTLTRQLGASPSEIRARLRDRVLTIGLAPGSA